MIPPVRYRNRTYEIELCADGGPCTTPDCDSRHQVIEVVPKIKHVEIANASVRQSEEIRRLQAEQRMLINERHKLSGRLAAS